MVARSERDQCGRAIAVGPNHSAERGHRRDRYLRVRLPAFPDAGRRDIRTLTADTRVAAVLCADGVVQVRPGAISCRRLDRPPAGSRRGQIRHSLRSAAGSFVSARRLTIGHSSDTNRRQGFVSARRAISGRTADTNCERASLGVRHGHRTDVTELGVRSMATTRTGTVASAACRTPELVVLLAITRPTVEHTSELGTQSGHCGTKSRSCPRRGQSHRPCRSPTPGLERVGRR